MFRVCKTKEIGKVCHCLGMKFFRVERNTSLLMVLAAVAGLAWANSPLWLGLDQLRNLTFGISSIQFTLEGWIYNFGIPAFFFLVGLELKREFTSGVLRKPRAVLVPGLAALLGVILPALTYLVVAGGDSTAATGWPIPTATDVTFSLAVLLIFGKTLPPVARTFLLSFAVIDDLVAITIITVLFLGNPGPVSLAWAVAYALMFAALVRISSSSFWKLGICLLAGFAALLALYFTVISGMQASVMGVVLGLLVPARFTKQIQEALHPWIATLVLPLFALFAVGVNLGQGNLLGEPVFWAVMTRPVSKFLGVLSGGLLGKRISGEFRELSTSVLARVAILAGIGFTISLLVARLTFGLEPAMQTAAVAGTLLATLVSASIGALALVRAHRA
jgi:NhaA family Na+:H+ antiporter